MDGTYIQKTTSRVLLLIMNLIYNFSIAIYGFLIRLAASFNPKARLWVNGRKDVWSKLKLFDSEGQVVYWFHCASLGEFEQGRPVMEKLKSERKCKIVVSFFSPSGYEIRKNYEGADLIFYLPLDTKKNAEKVYSILKPHQVFFVKYEFWANYIFTLKRHNVKLYLVSGIFRSNQIFFKWYGRFFRKALLAFELIFVQNEASQSLLKKIDVESIYSGDTRYDRVMGNAENVQQIEIVKAFTQGNESLVVGSSWSEDEAILFPAINDPSFKDKVIIAPHEIKEARLSAIEAGLTKKCIRFSKVSTDIQNYDVLIIDNIGMLMHIYQYAKKAFVGGGFRTGLHNILEPAAFGVPVMFGPNHQKFPEATLFIEQKIGFEVSTTDQFLKVYQTLSNNPINEKVLDFMKANTGATDTILKAI